MWLGNRAMSTIASSGDPRAREFDRGTPVYVRGHVGVVEQLREERGGFLEGAVGRQIRVVGNECFRTKILKHFARPLKKEASRGATIASRRSAGRLT